MFLKIATLLAILGLLLSLLLAIIQAFLMGSMGYYYFGSSMQVIYRLLTLGEVITPTVPLIVFLVAFFFSLKLKQN